MTSFEKDHCSFGQSYKAPTIVNYDSIVVPDWKIPHITTLESQFTSVKDWPLNIVTAYQEEIEGEKGKNVNVQKKV